MKLPLVAIVGRPNVGKSSLFNAFVGARVAIVDPLPGVTRDRVSRIIVHGDVTMELMDTGGIGIVDRDDLGEHVERQIEFAVRAANVILFVTDAKDGVTALDRDVARRLRDRAKEIPLILLVNKVDTPRQESDVHEFHALGMGDPRSVSATHRLGLGELLDEVVGKLWPTGDVNVEPVLQLAVVGRQNVGKSTFVNAILQEERMIVSEVPGTTRDSVDVHFEKDGLRFVIIDTAGVKQISRARSSVDVYSQFRTQDAVRRADVALLLLDASSDITRADKRLGDFIATESKLCIIVANKWDLCREKIATGEYAAYITKAMPLLTYAPVVFTTALDSRNVRSALDLAQHLHKKAMRRVGTGELNRVVEAIKTHHIARAKGPRVPRIYYATQVASTPPTFAVFVNQSSLFSAPYLRYMEGALREALDLAELPIRILLREKERDEKDSPRSR